MAQHTGVIQQHLMHLANRLAAEGVDRVLADPPVLGRSGRHEVRYLPFEYVNPAARLCLVGITPGPNQIELAYRALATEPLAALESDASREQVLRRIKQVGSFGGSAMRPGLLRLLRAFPFAQALGIDDVAQLWGERMDLVQFTSMVPDAAFEGGKPFNGGFDAVLRSQALRGEFEQRFVPSVRRLDARCRFVALGPKVAPALEWCVRTGVLRADQVLGAFPHPSGAAGSQVDIYLADRSPESLKAADPVRRRLPWLLSAAQSMRQSTDAWAQAAATRAAA